MKMGSVLQTVALVLILIFSGVSLLLSYETYVNQGNNASQLNEQYNKVSQELATIINALPNSTYVVLAHNEQIGALSGWSQWVNVTEYRTAYLYFDTTAGAPNATLAVLFDSSSSRGLLYGTSGIASPTIPIEIGAFARTGVVKIDIQGDIMEFGIHTMTNGNYIITSISLYLVT